VLFVVRFAGEKSKDRVRMVEKGKNVFNGVLLYVSVCVSATPRWTQVQAAVSQERLASEERRKEEQKRKEPIEQAERAKKKKKACT
jgi:hypothetical protein